MFAVGEIFDYHATLVRERQLGFPERNTVLTEILELLVGIPFEPSDVHRQYIPRYG